jgi:hypothetical protein
MEHQILKPTKAIDSLKFYEETGLSLFVRENNWYISGDCTKKEAEDALKAHDASKPKLTTVEKLAAIGISIDDLKAALGV